MPGPSGDIETICAISTPLGEGGIGVIRISGTRAIEISDKVFQSSGKKRLSERPSHTVSHGKIVDASREEVLDEVMAALFRGPRSYTCEDTVEFSCHGNLQSMTRIMALLIRAGAREAAPGEFTKRAFLNGRIDLAQAEGVIDFITSQNETARIQALKHLSGEFSGRISEIREALLRLLSKLEANIDFAEEDIEILAPGSAKAEGEEILRKIKAILGTARDGKILREGFLVVIAGRPNAGKSSLLNALLDRERAIVTAIAGTTRDILEERAILQGLTYRLVDTAGMRESSDIIEIEGIRRAKAEMEKADLVLWVVDSEAGWRPEDSRGLENLSGKNYLVVFNKTDLAAGGAGEAAAPSGLENIIKVSSLKKTGLEALQKAMAGISRRFSRKRDLEEGVVVTRARHEEALRKGAEALKRALESLEKNLSFEFVALDLRDTADALGEILGITAPDELLDRIFKEFCIGK